MQMYILYWYFLHLNIINSDAEMTLNLYDKTNIQWYYN